MKLNKQSTRNKTKLRNKTENKYKNVKGYEKMIDDYKFIATWLIIILGEINLSQLGT